MPEVKLIHDVQRRASGLFRKTLRGIAIGGDGRLYVAGDSKIAVLDAEGKQVGGWGTSSPAISVGVDGGGAVWVGEWQQVECFDGEGHHRATWRDTARLGLVTAIGFHENDVFLADATARWVHRYDREGKLLNHIGDRHRKGGFHIPNGVVDFAVDPQGILHVANPGMHRVERYRPDGELIGRFGRFDGIDPAGFPGCCNPTNVALDPAGNVVVSEKAPPRVKAYDPEGDFLGVVAAGIFDDSAKNMDLAIDEAGRIYVADPVERGVRVFPPLAGGAR